MRCWCYDASGACIGSFPHYPGGEVSTLPTSAHFRGTMPPIAFRYVHPGFPGVIVSDDDNDGEECIFPPVPGRDFVPARDAVMVL
jgi:hypothetical protein